MLSAKATAKIIGAGLTCSSLIISCGEFVLNSPILKGCGEFVLNSPILIGCGEFIIDSPKIIGCGVTALALILYYEMSEEVLNALKNAGKVIGLAIASGTAVGTSNAISTDRLRQYREAQAKEEQLKLEEQKAKIKAEANAKALTEEMKKYHKPK